VIIRVVLDTNVTISALFWRGAPYRVVLLAKAKVIQAVYCDEMLAELADKLREKFDFDANHLHATLLQIRQYAERVEISGDLHVIANDPDDDKFVECASVGQAQWIVSGDKHLRDLREYQGIRISTAEDFLTEFSAEQPATDEG
jgi:putative PIN family toxin of toxin-antitoxin system